MKKFIFISKQIQNVQIPKIIFKTNKIMVSKKKKRYHDGIKNIN